MKNCDKLTREKKVKPLLVTDEPLCANVNELACGDGLCIAKNLFCNGEKDCADGSDENVCGKTLLTIFRLSNSNNSSKKILKCIKYFSKLHQIFSNTTYIIRYYIFFVVKKYIF